MPVQCDDWWEKYLREDQGMRGVSVLSVWDCRAVIKEVARCHSRPRAVFSSAPGDRQDQLDKAWMSRPELKLHCKHPLRAPLRASQGPSIPLHRITVATAPPRLPINPLASRSFLISLPAPQPVSSCPTTPGLTIAYPAAFKSVSPGPVKLLSA